MLQLEKLFLDFIFFQWIVIARSGEVDDYRRRPGS